MGRVKQNKKSTFIDMTAMSDVTVLLLTFFMLTSTFLAKAPFQANTPPSVSQDEMPMTNVVEILVNPQGKVWLTMNNDTTQMASNARMRVKMLKHMSQIYKEQTDKTVDFTKADSVAFSKQGSFGVPFNQLPTFLRATAEEQDQWLSGKEEKSGKISGIPVEILDEARKEKIRHSNNRTGLTEFQMWILAAANAAAEVANEMDDEAQKTSLMQKMKDGTGFALRADQTSPYKTIHMIMDNMQTIGKNKFILVTALKQEE